MPKSGALPGLSVFSPQAGLRTKGKNRKTGAESRPGRTDGASDGRDSGYDRASKIFVRGKNRKRRFIRDRQNDKMEAD